MPIDMLDALQKWRQSEQIKQATEEARMMQEAKLAQLLSQTKGLDISNEQQALKQRQAEFVAPLDRRNTLVSDLGPNVGAAASIAADPAWNTKMFQPSAVPTRHTAPLAAELQQPSSPWDVSKYTNPVNPAAPVQGDIQGTVPEVARKAASNYYNMGMENQRKVGLTAETYPFSKDLQLTQDAGAMARLLKQNESEERRAAGHDATLRAGQHREQLAAKGATIRDITTKAMLQGGQLQPAIDNSFQLMAEDKKKFKAVGDEGSGRLEAYQSQLNTLGSAITRYKMAMEAAEESAIAEQVDPNVATKAYRDMLIQAQSTYTELKKRHDAEMSMLLKAKTISPWHLPQLGSDVGP